MAAPAEIPGLCVAGIRLHFLAPPPPRPPPRRRARVKQRQPGKRGQTH